MKSFLRCTCSDDSVLLPKEKNVNIYADPERALLNKKKDGSYDTVSTDGKESLEDISNHFEEPVKDQLNLYAEFSAIEIVLALIVYFGMGIIAYSYMFEHWSIVDSVYYGIVTFTTVGFGDIYPSSYYGRLFACFYSFIGVAFIGVVLGTVGAQFVENEMHQFKNSAEKLANLVAESDIEENLPHKDVDNASFQEEEGGIFHGASSILGGLLVISLVLLGAFYIGSFEGWDWSKCVYFAMITAATIGYGDLTPNEDNRLFACVYICFTFCATSYFFSALVNNIIDHKRQKILAHFQSSKLEWKDVQVMDKDGDGQISQSEYVEYMLTALNLVNPEIIEMLHKRFEYLDYSKNGYLDKDDVTLWSKRTLIKARSSALNAQNSEKRTKFLDYISTRSLDH